MKRGTGRGRLRRALAGLMAAGGLVLAVGSAGLPPLPDWPAAAWGTSTAEGEGPVPFLQRLLLGESALLAQWAAAAGETPAAPTEAEPEPELEAVTPDKIQEKTLAGSGTDHVSGRGGSLCSTARERPWT